MLFLPWILYKVELMLLFSRIKNEERVCPTEQRTSANGIDRMMINKEICFLFFKKKTLVGSFA